MYGFEFYTINIFSIAFLLLIRIHSGWSVQRKLYVSQLFLLLVDVNLIMLVIDSLAWVFNEQPGELFIQLNTLFNLLLYIFAIVPVVLWLIYADFQIYADRSRIKRLLIIIAPFVLINTALSILSLKANVYFYIDAQNVYHRGAFFYVHVALCYGLLMLTTLMIFLHRRKIDNRHYLSLLLYPLPMIIGSVLQVLFYGLTLNWSCMALSVFIVYFNIQNAGLSTDYLTGVSNRRLLDSYLKEKIRYSKSGETFSAILIDMDQFKQINDVHGHHVGDVVLQETVRLLRDCVRSQDLIARFGGDEFYIVLSISDRDRLEAVVERIRQTVDDYNAAGDCPYRIVFTMGYDVYDPDSGMDFEAFLRHIDALMYQKKPTAKGPGPVAP